MIRGEEKDGSEVGSGRINRKELSKRVGEAERKGGHSVLRRIGYRSRLPNSNPLISQTMP